VHFSKFHLLKLLIKFQNELLFPMQNYGCDGKGANIFATEYEKIFGSDRL